MGLPEGGINKVPARFSCFVSCFSAFYFSPVFSPLSFACTHNNWRIALRRLYMEHMMHIDSKLMLAVKSLEEQEFLPQHKTKVKQLKACAVNQCPVLQTAEGAYWKAQGES